MGLPWMQAPFEADAQCAALCLYGKVYGVISEDRDVLAFRSPITINNFSISQ